jgi:hypothetical protein
MCQGASRGGNQLQDNEWKSKKSGTSVNGFKVRKYAVDITQDISYGIDTPHHNNDPYSPYATASI